jgi:Tol biopolymer transport system component
MNNYLPAFFLILYGFLNTGAWGINIPENISATLNREYDPAFSPNGRYIVYCVEVEGDENIWLLDLDNRKRRRITSHSASDYAPAFMGNSTILFVTRRGNSLGEIYKTDLNGKKQELIIGGNGYYDAPAPDGNGDRIAYIHNEFNDSVFIYIYDTKSKTTQKGPEGLDPEFFPSGDSVLFISPVGDNDKNELVIYSLVDSSVSYPVTRSGLILNPVIFDDGDRILYENKSRDTDDDGNVTINDDSDLMILNLRDKSVIRLLPGFDFANPDVSINGQVCAQDDDGKIYIFNVRGITEKQADHVSQRTLCDSLILHSLTHRDSLIAGVAC